MEDYHPYEGTNGEPVDPASDIEQDSSDDESEIEEVAERLVPASHPFPVHIEEPSIQCEQLAEQQFIQQEERAEHKIKISGQKRTKSHLSESPKREEQNREETMVLKEILRRFKEEHTKRIQLEEIVSKLEYQSNVAKMERRQLLGWIKELGSWAKDMERKVQLVEKIKMELR